jgi:hypothetical protein
MKAFYLISSILIICILSCEKSQDPLSAEKKADYLYKTRLKEYEYVKNQFFMIDFYYQSVFESSYDPQHMFWIINNIGKRIINLEIWIDGNPVDPYTRAGWTVADPANVLRDSLGQPEPINGVQVWGFFKRLEKSEYEYDEYRGFFKLNRPVDEKNIIAIAYSTESGDQIGMYSQDITDPDQTVILKLIKASNMIPSYPTWPLQMQNVYKMDIDRTAAKRADLKVIYTGTGKNLLIQPLGERKTFIYLMGLDRLTINGESTETGDGRIDWYNANIFDTYNGFLMFPSLRPFDPNFCTQFKIDTSLAVKIYVTRDQTTILQEHKFDIEITIPDTISSNSGQP